jgi:hypothetical protein
MTADDRLLAEMVAAIREVLDTLTADEQLALAEDLEVIEVATLEQIHALPPVTPEA